MRVTPFTGGGFAENGYLVVCAESGAAVAVDPGAASDRMAEAVTSEGLRLEAVLLTHAHLDHVEGVHRIRAVSDAPIYLHPADRGMYDALGEQAAMFGLRVDPQPPPDRALAHGQRIAFGACAFDVRHAPGLLEYGHLHTVSKAARIESLAERRLGRRVLLAHPPHSVANLR